MPARLIQVILIHSVPTQIILNWRGLLIGEVMLSEVEISFFGIFESI